MNIQYIYEAPRYRAHEAHGAYDMAVLWRGCTAWGGSCTRRGCTEVNRALCQYASIRLNHTGDTKMAKKVLQLTGGAYPLFSWRLPQEIAAYKQAKLQAQQWIHVINGFSQKGIKQSEIEDSGVAEWLQDQGKRQVTREELAEVASYALPSIKEARLTGSDVKYRDYSFAGVARTTTRACSISLQWTRTCPTGSRSSTIALQRSTLTSMPWAKIRMQCSASTSAVKP